MRLSNPMQQPAVRPRLACEFAPDGILAGSSAGVASPLDRTAFLPLPDRISAVLASPIFSDRDAVLKALKSALDEISSNGRDWTVIVPDACARVLLLDFDTLPSKHQEVLPLIRFRLRRMIPFDADTAAVSYQVLNPPSVAGRNGTVRVIAAAMPAEVREEIESLMREQERETGALLPATLAALAAVPGTGSHLMVHTGEASITTAITREGELLLYRRTELSGSGPAEMAEAVLIAAAYYEDTLQLPLEEIWVCGLETPEALRMQLEMDGSWQIPLRNLIDSGAFDAAAVPGPSVTGRYASVVGALRG